ncbi:MAG: TIGR03915 family putative DNA repair protein [Pyrinomonadaceae bacterium]
MISVSIDNTFASWRDAARPLIRSGVSPDDILWISTAQVSLFEAENHTSPKNESFRVPSLFFQLAELASCFDDQTRWALMYRILFRLVFQNRNLLSIESDNDVRRLQLMARAVRRDIHKFHAFVRFRKAEFEDKEVFVAWHEPHHFTVELATPFFARRFGSMNFSILTPKGCAHWDREELTFSDPVDKARGPSSDEVEDFWLMYYRSIFNPFRLKINAMKKELPVRHWRTLPEAVLIPELIRDAAVRNQTDRDLA